MKKKRCNNLIFKIMFITCLLLFIYSFLNIIKWEKENRKAQEKAHELQNMVEINTVEDDTTSENKSNIILVGHEDEDENSSYWYYSAMNMIDVNLDSLLKENSDTKGWIVVPGTNIDYPFVQTKNNKYYLNHSFDKSYTDAGWVFMDYRNDINNLGKNNIIYGHARLDRTMFGSLRNTLKKEWYNNKDNHIVKLSTENENTLWQIFSVYHLKTESYYITTNFKSDDDFQKYIDKSLSRSIYDFDVNLNTSDTILTLSTCYGENKKLVVQAKLIKKEIKNP